jgi:hypothetical protein
LKLVKISKIVPPAFIPHPFAYLIIIYYVRIAEEVQTTEIQLADQDAVHMYILLEYLRQYNDHFFSIVMVGSPLRDPGELSLLGTDHIGGHTQLLMNTILGIGSLVAGDATRSEELLSRARRMLGEYFDESSAFICASHCLFSYLQSENGNLEKALFYNRTAVSSLEALILKHKGRDEIDGINVVYLYLSALLHDVRTLTLFHEISSLSNIFDPSPNSWTLRRSSTISPNRSCRWFPTDSIDFLVIWRLF